MLAFRNVAFVAIFFALFAACEPAPSRVLTEDEKRADMLWLFSIFDENYAPRELKEAVHEFDYEELKDQYLEEAVATEDNESFYLVMHRFVAEFADVHTSSSIVPSKLPGRTQIAYLGFNGRRVGDSLVVTDLLPTISAASNFPLQVGDEIVKFNGRPLPEVVREDITKYRDLGHAEANLTANMNAIFNRTPLVHPLPTDDNAVVTVLDGGEELDIELPWIVKDLSLFLEEQEAAAGTASAEMAGVPEEAFFRALREIAADDPSSLLDVPVSAFRGERFWDHFAYVETMPTLLSESVVRKVKQHLRAEEPGAPTSEALRARVSAVRTVPQDAVFLPDAQTYPTYIAPYPDGSSGMYAYMLLDTFSPEAGEDVVVAEVQAVLNRLDALGIDDLVIDTINNGGGSLSLGMQLAKLFSREPLELPQIQFKISDSWIDQFVTQSLSAPSDAERELARRVADDLKTARDAGQVLSEPMGIDVLMPFAFLEGNPELGELDVTVLVNEMCASMCDIFAATLQDNELATIMGTRTVGAGGNVVMHAQAPNSHLTVNQTESLILRTDGTPIENVGVFPDVEVDVNATVLSQYAPVVDQAVEFLRSQDDSCEGDCEKSDDFVGRDDPRAGGCSAAAGTGSAASALLVLMAVAFATSRRRRHA